MRYSDWFAQLRYGDAPIHNLEHYWPDNVGDVALPDSLPGPSAADLALLPDPAGLYYKHLIPFPDPGLPDTLIDPEGSVSSVVARLDGGDTTGAVLRTVTLFIHPDLEAPLVDQVGVEGRVTAIVKPFLEGAVGHTVDFDDAKDLYEAAMDHAPGLIIALDDTYVGAVQLWFGRDASIHVVEDLRSPQGQ